MTEIESKKSLYDMIYLTGCGVNGLVPKKEIISKMHLEDVFSVSKFHLLNAVTCIALESAGISDGEVMKKWRESKNKAIRKNMLLDADRTSLLQFMDENKIWYMPLKGVIIKEFYPKFGMRQMSDNDILFDKMYQKNVYDWFVKNGYKAMSFGKNNHDSYEKKPVFNYEMHTSLFDVRHNSVWCDYYKNVKDRLIKDDDNSCGFHFSDEDFYVYITLHAYKHYSDSGTGLRSLLDSYMYLKEKLSSMDFTYIQSECEKLGISDFEKNVRELSFQVFENPEDFCAENLSEDKHSMLEWLMYSGVYGTMENRIKNKLDELEQKTGKRSKWQYYKSRIFPDMEYYRNFYPLIYKYKFLLPFCWIFRLLKGVTVNKKKIGSEIRNIQNVK